MIDTIGGVTQNELGFVDGEMLEQEPILLLLPLDPRCPEYDLVVNIQRLVATTTKLARCQVYNLNTSIGTTMIEELRSCI